jgi:hypothetical protein
MGLADSTRGRSRGHFVGSRTAANVGLDRICGAQMNPVLGGVFVELQEHIGAARDLGDRFGILGAVVSLEGLDRDLRVVDILGVVDVLDRRQGAGVR